MSRLPVITLALGLLMLGIAVPLAEHTQFIHPWFAWLSGGIILGSLTAMSRSRWRS